MLKSIDVLEEGFLDISRTSKEECCNELERMRQLMYTVIPFIHKAIENRMKVHLPKYLNSLIYSCFMELFRKSGHILFLSINGLYKNAFHEIRYVLESVLQAYYIDKGHPKADIMAKIEVLKEIEDMPEFNCGRLIANKIKIDLPYAPHRKVLKKEYQKLSKLIHPSHQQLIDTFVEVSTGGGKGIPATVDCKEISKIYESTKMMYDIFFFLLINLFPELKEPLKKDSDFIKSISDYELILLSKVLEVRLNTQIEK